MHNPHIRPSPSRAARRFNLGVAALVFALMLAFAGWMVATGGADLVRVGAGLLTAGAALTLLAAVRDEWRSGEPFQHSRKGLVGFSLFTIGATVLAVG